MTVTPGITAPCSSLIVPESLPRSNCAAADVAVIANSVAAKSNGWHKETRRDVLQSRRIMASSFLVVQWAEHSRPCTPPAQMAAPARMIHPELAETATAEVQTSPVADEGRRLQANVFALDYIRPLVADVDRLGLTDPIDSLSVTEHRDNHLIVPAAANAGHDPVP